MPFRLFWSSFSRAIHKAFAAFSYAPRAPQQSVAAMTYLSPRLNLCILNAIDQTDILIGCVLDL